MTAPLMAAVFASMTRAGGRTLGWLSGTDGVTGCVGLTSTSTFAGGGVSAVPGTGGDGDTALFSGVGVGLGLGFTSTSLGALGLPLASVFGAVGGTTSTVVLLWPAVSARAAVKPS